MKAILCPMQASASSNMEPDVEAPVSDDMVE
jgi:hypothetical protein